MTPSPPPSLSPPLHLDAPSLASAGHATPRHPARLHAHPQATTPGLSPGPCGQVRHGDPPTPRTHQRPRPVRAPRHPLGDGDHAQGPQVGGHAVRGTVLPAAPVPRYGPACPLPLHLPLSATSTSPPGCRHLAWQGSSRVNSFRTQLAQCTRYGFQASGSTHPTPIPICLYLGVCIAFAQDLMAATWGPGCGFGTPSASSTTSTRRALPWLSLRCAPYPACCHMGDLSLSVGWNPRTQ
jgi:hypothetical protein